MVWHMHANAQQTGQLMVFVEPIYVSETVAKTMNPTFRHIDFTACGPGITRLDKVSVKVWVKSVKMADWRQLMELELDLRSLQYLGKSVSFLRVLLVDCTDN